MNPILPQNAPVKGSDRACPNSFDSPDRENPLTKGLLIAQQSSQGTKKREKLFERLVAPHLKPHLHCKNSYLFSKEDHEEAENDTILAVYNNLDRLTPSHIVPFIKKVLNNKLVDKIRPSANKRTVSLDEIMGEDGQTAFIDTIAQPEPDPAIAEQEKIKEIVDNDPDQMLQKHIQGRPELTWQTILQYRLQGLQWQELAKLSGKSVSTLNSFDKREINRLTPYLKEALSSL